MDLRVNKINYCLKVMCSPTDMDLTDIPREANLFCWKEIYEYFDSSSWPLKFRGIEGIYIHDSLDQGP
jgi:hypothetical protein